MSRWSKLTSKRQKILRYLVLALILLIAIGVGFWIRVLVSEPTKMPPKVQKSDPAESYVLKETEVYLSPSAQKLAQVQVTPATREAVTAEVRLIGEVDYDETKVAYITSWIPGRIEQLYVDYTGKTVNKNEPMLQIYSPELISAQEELISAVRALEKIKKSPSKVVIKAMAATVESAREKLRLWGLSAQQIEEVEELGVPQEFLTILSPIAGIVVEKEAFEGMYVEEGSLLYTVADLSEVWIPLEGYESDLVWLKVGQKARFTVEALPGQLFEGTITFIDPFLNPQTRTAEVRVEAPNPRLLLKPGMFTHAVIQVPLSTAGELEELIGYTCGSPSDKPPLVIPASAPLITGKRAVVYVADPKRNGVYEGREIILGPRFGDFYIVCSGLREGELVVTHGNFKIDSEIQIQAKPSMMNPKGADSAPMHGH